MIVVLLLTALVSIQESEPRDSAQVARLLVSLRAADSTVCELAGRALTNFGGFWNIESDLPMPMPMPIPMPIPMPMPFGGPGIQVNPRIHGLGRGAEQNPATLGAFRAALRDPSRCVRHIAARVVGRRRSTRSSRSYAIESSCEIS